MQWTVPNLLDKVLPARGGGSRIARHLRLCTEGLLYTGCALVLADALQVPQSGFFAVFLAAAGLTGRLDGILDDHRVAVSRRNAHSWRTNAASATGLLALFLGMFVAFAVGALWLGEARMAREFAFVLDVTRIGQETLQARAFGSVPSLAVHNALVLLVFFSLSFVYRSYGALLALSWNACIWGVVLTLLVRRGVVASAAHPTAFVALACVAVLPHLVCEAASYTCGALGALLLSRGLFKHAPGEALFRSLLRSVGTLLAVAVVALLVAAFVESFLPRRVLALLAA